MAKNSVDQWALDPSANTDVGGNNIAENCPPSTINNAIRSVMAQVRAFYNNTARLDANNTFTGANSFSGSATFKKLVSSVSSAEPNDGRGLRFLVDGVEYLQAYYDNARTIMYSGGAGFRFMSPIEVLGQPFTLAAGSAQAANLRGVKFTIDGVEVGAIVQENTGLLVDADGYFRTFVDGAERFRSTSTSFGFGVTTDKTDVSDTGNGAAINYAGILWANRTNAVTAILKRTGTDGAVVQFGKGTVAVGSISVTTTATAFNTSSDGRLKTDFQPIPADLLDHLRVYDYAWKTEGGRAYGAIAQELEQVIPQAVSKGETPDDMWSVDYSKLVPILIASIQDLRARLSRVESGREGI